jgi:hypothetical protein
MAGRDHTPDLSPGAFGRALHEFLEVSLALAPAEESELAMRVRRHLEVEDLGALPIHSRDLGPPDHPNLQVALDHLVAERRWDMEVVGLRSEQAAMMGGLTLSSLAAEGVAPGLRFAVPRPGPVERVRVALEPGESVACLMNVLLLLRRAGRPLVGLIARRERMMGGSGLRLEIVAREEADALDALAELEQAMREHNVYRGRVLSFSRDEEGGVGIAVRRLPEVTRESIVLPDGVLERIERQALAPARHRDRLLAAGRHLKRGLLLHGPPGTGKTLSVMHVVSRLPGHTVVILTGGAFGVIEPAAALARDLQPAVVVLEDVDLIAHERAFDDDYGPLLFSLLNEMDGLADDADVLFVLTTNRPDVLEPALAARPGRIDQAVELPLPDAADRRRLIELYAEGLVLHAEHLDRLVERLEGASPAHIKELLRKAALIAAEARDDDPLVIRDADLDEALDDLVIGTADVRASLFGNTPPEAAFPFPPDPELD